MLADNFYTILQSGIEESTVHASLTIHAGHAIFEGHFPDQPIVPGVCMIQIAREVAEHALEKKLRITKGDNIKFLAMLNPHETPVVNLTVHLRKNNTEHGVQATLFAGAVVFFKFNGTFQEI